MFEFLYTFVTEYDHNFYIDGYFFKVDHDLLANFVYEMNETSILQEIPLFFISRTPVKV